MVSWSPRSSLGPKIEHPRAGQEAQGDKVPGCRNFSTHDSRQFPKSVFLLLFGVIFRVSCSTSEGAWRVCHIDERWLSQSLVMIRSDWSIIHINVLFNFDPKLPKLWFSMEKSCQGWSEIYRFFRGTSPRIKGQVVVCGGHSGFVTPSNHCKLQQSKRSGRGWGSWSCGKWATRKDAWQNLYPCLFERPMKSLDYHNIWWMWWCSCNCVSFMEGDRKKIVFGFRVKQNTQTLNVYEHMSNRRFMIPCNKLCCQP